jgi:hypothetical protein
MIDVKKNEAVTSKQNFEGEEESWLKLTRQQKVTPDDQEELRKWEDLGLLSGEVLANGLVQLVWWFWLDDLRSSCSFLLGR